MRGDVALGGEVEGFPEVSLEQLESLKMEFFEMMRRLHQVRPVPFGTFQGVTPTEARALLMIGVAVREQGQDTVRPGCVAAHMHVTPSALSQVLKALEGKGLVRRGRGGDDFRAVALTLTPEGSRLAAQIEQRWTEQALALVSYVGADEFRAMIAAANRVADYFEKVKSGQIKSPLFSSFGEGAQASSRASSQASSQAEDSACGFKMPCLCSDAETGGGVVGAVAESNARGDECEAPGAPDGLGERPCA